MTSEPYYRPALSRIHHEAFGFHAHACARGILDLLEPVGGRGGLVLEIGCGSGALTRRLVRAGHRVIATDASPAMLALAREAVPEAEAVTRLVLPDDPLPSADAVVSVGHVLNYLPDTLSIERALRAIAAALLPGSVLAIDLLDRSYREARSGKAPIAKVTAEWALCISFSSPDATTYVRHHTTFVRTSDGAWRRDDERHRNVLVDAGRIIALLAGEGVDAVVNRGFGAGQQLEDGLVVVVGIKREWRSS